jgi:hypothetical protein
MLKLLSRVLLAALVLGAALLGSAPSSAAPALATRSSDEAGVRVVVTPKALGRDVTVWEFNVVMDTHTKPLNDNLAQAAVLYQIALPATHLRRYSGLVTTIQVFELTHVYDAIISAQHRVI